MTIREYKEKYSSLSHPQVKKLSEESQEFRTETETLYKKAYKADLNKSCSECWVDAYVLLMKIDDKKFDALSSRNFDLKAGALLLDRVNGDNSKMCTRVNLTDELALYHLKTNPGCADQFSVLPDNWKELVENYGKETHTAEAQQEDDDDNDNPEVGQEKSGDDSGSQEEGEQESKAAEAQQEESKSTKTAKGKSKEKKPEEDPAE